jgi:Tfp pilus assembly protein PilO
MMKGSSNRIVAGMLVAVALAAAFWILVLAPKRQEASTLGESVQRQQAMLAEGQLSLQAAEAARDEFSDSYRRLVVLGKAVPGDDDTASLMVELQAIAGQADIRFEEFLLNGGGAEAEGSPPPAGAEPAPPTEVAAALLPLGAKIGPAGLATMP